ncbi:hypothetical protein [uncultured Tateyamaria sp.]|uniref:hypothetical protein n=1 Tax=Tateyamaria sp. 1078 TaxID=3417464 RepID=UPI002610E985|nr:hypothetical protein [uncultured Tateyamaria sp.]
MLPLKRDHQTVPPHRSRLSAQDVRYLDDLRRVAMACRVKPRADLFEACALLQVTRGATRAAHAEALMRGLNEALGKPARLHAPGADELTFDEMWLLQLGRAVATGDAASLTFLLGRRVCPEHRRLVRFLVSRIVACQPRS